MRESCVGRRAWPPGMDGGSQQEELMAQLAAQGFISGEDNAELEVDEEVELCVRDVADSGGEFDTAGGRSPVSIYLCRDCRSEY